MSIGRQKVINLQRKITLNLKKYLLQPIPKKKVENRMIKTRIFVFFQRPHYVAQDLDLEYKMDYQIVLSKFGWTICNYSFKSIKF